MHSPSRKRSPHVVVFFGGEQPHHDLSRASGEWFCNHAPRESFQITPIRITPEGNWQVPLGSLPRYGSVQNMVAHLFSNLRHLSPTEGLQRLMNKPADAIINLLRGKGGDDGQLQSTAATLGLAVIGPDAGVCHITSNKPLCYSAVDHLVATPHTLAFKASDQLEEIEALARDQFMTPVFVKPTNSESSWGTEEVTSFEELTAAITRLKRDGGGLIQEAILGPELNITLIPHRKYSRTVALPATTIVPQRSTFYDHLAKRFPGRVKFHTDAQADNVLVDEAIDAAQNIYEHLGCQGIVSFDFKGAPGYLVLLEVNAIPAAAETTPLHDQLHQAKLSPTAMWDIAIRRQL